MRTHTFVKRTHLPFSADAVFDWHARPGAFARLTPPWERVVVEERTGGLEVGARTVVTMAVGPVPQRWVAEHTACEPGRLFRDEQREGPFARWVHTHRFIPEGDGACVLEDELEYALPMGGLGELFGAGPVEERLTRMFGYRHAVTQADLLRHRAYAGAPLTIAVTGASGLIGSELVPFLQGGGHTVRAVRRDAANRLDAASLEGADAVVHLAGAGIADARWRNARKRLLRESRVDFTRQLVAAMRARPPRVFLSGSAIGVYGDRGDEALTEVSEPGQAADTGAAYLAGLCRDWEAAGLEARSPQTRVVLLRTGVVLTAKGGALAKMLTPFRAGVGGPMGSGAQWMSWIALEDQLGAMLHALHRDDVEGPLNVVAPAPATSRDFAKALGQVLLRPALTPAPAFALRALFGELADGALLASQRVLPERLERSGFAFLKPSLEAALRFTLGR